MIISTIVDFDIITYIFHRMIDIHLKHDNMHKNGMVYALIFINNHIIICIDYMLSMTPRKQHTPFIPL